MSTSRASRPSLLPRFKFLFLIAALVFNGELVAQDQSTLAFLPPIINLLLDDQPRVSQQPGFAQKGPFRAGARVEASFYDEDGNDIGSFSGRRIFGSTNDDGQLIFSRLFGRPQLEVITMDATRWVYLVIEGDAFNEVTGADTPVRIAGLLRFENKTLIGNVNLYTWLVSARARQLIDDASEDTLSNAYNNALLDAYKEFGLGIDPAESDLLQSTTLDTRLLWISTALAAANLSQAELDSIVNDFADNGTIDGAGAAAWRDVTLQITLDNLLQGINNIETEYNVELVSTEPALEGISIECIAPILCETSTPTLGLPAQEFIYTPVQITESGTYALSVAHSTFNNFHRGTLRDANQGSVTTVGQGIQPTLPLKAGDDTIQAGAYLAGDASGTANLQLLRVGDGIQSSPKFVPMGVTVEGRISQRAPHNKSFYAVQAGRGNYRILINDVTSDQGFTIIVRDLTGEIGRLTTSGNLALTVGSQGDLYIELINTSSLNQNGSVFYSLKIVEQMP